MNNLKVAVVTDSNSGITQDQGRTMGITVVPMPFFINDKQYFEDVSLTQEQFYKYLKDDSIKLSTSMPSPGTVTDLWDTLLKDYQEIVYIPMSSGLSASCSTAKALAEDYDGKVEVVNNQRISVTQRQSVLDAMTLRDAGYTAKQIREKLEEEKFQSSIYIMVDTLKYLKKGGRITPAAALIGSVLSLKPVLQIQGEKLDAFSKARGVKMAKKIMLKQMHQDFDKRFKAAVDADEMCLQAAYSGLPGAATQTWLEEIKESFPGMEVHMDPLSLSVSCHIGAGALAIACAKKVSVD